MIIQGPVIAVLVFFCTAFTLMALRKSAASRGSESDSENSLWGSFSTHLCISGHNLYIYFHGYLQLSDLLILTPLTIDTQKGLKHASTRHISAKVTMDKLKTINLKLLDDYSGPVLALRRVSLCERLAV